MNRSLLLLVALISGLCGYQISVHAAEEGAPAANRQGDADIGRTMEGLVQQHTQGLLKNDLAALDRLWADDLTFINYRGQLLSKKDRLENLKTGATAFKSIDASELASRSISNDAAVTTCRVNLVAQYSGQEGSGDYRVTFVWGRTQGKWRLSALQMTKVESGK